MKPITINSIDGISGFAGYPSQISRQLNETDLEYYNQYTIITNPHDCIYNWTWTSLNVADSESRQFSFLPNNSSYAKVYDQFGNIVHGITDENNGTFQGSELFQVMFIDCKATAEKYIKQVKVEFEKPHLDFDKIQKSTNAKAVTFFYSSSFENNSPQTYNENFQYTETKDVTISLQSSVLDETMSSSSWMNSEMKNSNWEVSGTVGWGPVSITGGYGEGSSSTNEKSGTESHTHRTERTDGRTYSKSLSVTKTGSLTVEPFSRANVIGAHYDIKNTTINNIVWVKLGVDEHSDFYTSERICNIEVGRYRYRDQS